MASVQKEISHYEFRRILVRTYEDCGDLVEECVLGEVYYSKDTPVLFCLTPVFVADEQNLVATAFQKPIVRHFYETGVFDIPSSWSESHWRPKDGQSRDTTE